MSCDERRTRTGSARPPFRQFPGKEVILDDAWFPTYRSMDSWVHFDHARALLTREIPRRLPRRGISLQCGHDGAPNATGPSAKQPSA